MMGRKYPDWYYGPTTPRPGYEKYRLPKKLRGLIYLLRNNGWNTEGSGDSYRGIIVIQPYGEQFGWWQEEGGPIAHLRNFLWNHGYKHFEIKHIQFSWHGKVCDDVLILKLLGPEYGERWR